MLGADVVADYATFHARAAGLAAALRAEGTGPGDRIAIFATNCPDYLVALFGIWTAGAVAVPINAKLHPKEAAFILVDSGAARGFTSAALTDPLARETDLPADPAPFGGLLHDDRDRSRPRRRPPGRGSRLALLHIGDNGASPRACRSPMA